MFGPSGKERQREALRSQATAFGVEVLSFDELAIGDRSVADEAKQLFRLAAVGEAPTTTTSIDVYWLRAQIGTFLYAQPFQGQDALVGEFHVQLAGGLPQPIAFCRAAFWRKKWTTAEDPDLLRTLEASNELRSATKQLAWSRHTTRGEIDLDWTVQLSGLADGTSQLVVQAGNSPLDLHQSMLGPFLSVGHALAPLLRAEAVEQGRYFEPQYDWLFWAEEQGGSPA
jgi:hypothetical protein